MPGPERRRNRSLWVEVAIVVAFVTWVAWPLLQPGSYLTAYDTVTYSGPNLVVTSDQIRDGDLPVWNDDLFGGVPHLANPQVAALSPARWLLAPLGAATELDLTIALHLYVLAAGVFVLCWRRLRLAAPARLIGTVAIVGSGAVMARAQQFEQITVVAWIPWLLVATDWLLDGDRVRPRAIAATAAATALTLLSGHPQQMYIAVVLVAAWCVGRALDATRRSPTDGRAPADRLRALGGRAGRLAAGVGLGALLAAPQLVATAGLVRVAALEANQSLAQSSTYGYVVKPSLLAPTFFGNPFADQQWMTAMSSEAMAFVGVAVVALALVGLAVGLLERARRATVAILGLAAVASTVLAMGPRCDESTGALTCSTSGIAFRAAREILPGFAQTRAAGRWVLVATIALGLLAALGTDAIVRRAVTRRALAGAGVGAVLVALVVLVAGPTSDGGLGTATYTWWLAIGCGAVAAVLVGVLLPRRSAPVVAAGALAALVVLELAVPSARSTVRDHQTDTPFTAYATAMSTELAATGGVVLSVAGTKFDDWRYLNEALRPNANATYDARSVDGYDGGPWVTTRWVDAVRPMASGDFDPTLPLSWQLALPLDANRAARLGVGYAVVDLAQFRELAGDPDKAEQAILDGVTPGWDGPVARAGELVLVRNPVRSADGALAFATEVAADQDTAAALLTTAPADAAVVEEGPALSCDRGCTPQGVTTARPSAGAADVEVDLERPAVLSITAQPQPGWSVTVDGDEADVLAVDVVRTGVALEPGHHEVAFRYRQPGLRVALLVAFLALVLAAVLTWEPRRLRPAPPSA